MKKVLLVSLLPMLLAVSGCNPREVKKPSFVRYSNEVSYEQFMSAESTLIVNNKILSASVDPSKVPSYEATLMQHGKTEYIRSSSVSATKKELENDVTNGKANAKIKFDAMKSTMQYSANREVAITKSNDGGNKKTEGVGFDFLDFQLQMHEVQDSDPVGYVYNTRTSTAYSAGLSKNEVIVKSVDIARSSLDPIYRPGLVTWASYTTEERQNFHFYVDDNILTCVQKGRVVTENKDVDQNLLMIRVDTFSIISQFTYGETSYTHKAYVEKSYKVDAYEDFDVYKKGESVESKELRAVETTIKVNEKVSLSDKSDSDYHLADHGDLSSEYYTSVEVDF